MSFATRLLAEDVNETKRPSALKSPPLEPPFPCLPSFAKDTRKVEGVQPAGAPKQVSRTKTSVTPLVSFATRLLASELNETKRPSALSRPPWESAFP